MFVQPRNVVIRKLFKRVQSNDVINVEIHTVSLYTVGNSLQFLLILGVDMQPQHLAGSLAKELPIAL